MDKKKTTFSVSYFLFALLLAWLINDALVKPYVLKEMEVRYNVFSGDIEREEINNVTLTNDCIAFELKNDESKAVMKNTIRVEDNDLINMFIKKMSLLL